MPLSLDLSDVSLWSDSGHALLLGNHRNDAVFFPVPLFIPPLSEGSAIPGTGNTAEVSALTLLTLWEEVHREWTARRRKDTGNAGKGLVMCFTAHPTGPGPLESPTHRELGLQLVSQGDAISCHSKAVPCDGRYLTSAVTDPFVWEWTCLRALGKIKTLSASLFLFVKRRIKIAHTSKIYCKDQMQYCMKKSFSSVSSIY